MSLSHTDRPRVGLIGVSGYAQIYTDLLMEDENAQRIDWAAVTVIPKDQNLEIVGNLRARKLRLYSDFETFIAQERGKLDLCIVPTGIHWHARMSIAAMQAGMNVLVEKPLAGSLADAEKIITVEKATGQWIAVGFQDVYTDTATWFKQQLLSGTIGRIKSVRFIGLWPRSEDYYRRTDWAGRLQIDGVPTLDSPLNNALAHFVNLALYFCGPSMAESSRVEVTDAELYRAHDIESFDTAVVKARSTGDTEFWFGVTHSCEVYREPDILFEGEHGTAAWYHQRHCVISPDGIEEVVKAVPDYEVTRQAMMTRVLDRLTDPTVQVCSSRIALCHTAFIQELHDKGTIVSIDKDMIENTRLASHQNPVPTITGIDVLMDRAFRKGCMLQDVRFNPIHSLASGNPE